MDKITIIGLIAASLTTMSFVPQAIQVIRTRDTKGLSLTMYILFTCGIILWLTYGILIWDMPIILCNTITLVLALTILSMKIKHG
jgi:MtN3 and saliva related transmembrane protein